MGEKKRERVPARWVAWVMSTMLLSRWGLRRLSTTTATTTAAASFATPSSFGVTWDLDSDKDREKKKSLLCELETNTTRRKTSITRLIRGNASAAPSPFTTRPSFFFFFFFFFFLLLVVVGCEFWRERRSRWRSRRPFLSRLVTETETEEETEEELRAGRSHPTSVRGRIRCEVIRTVRAVLRQIEDTTQEVVLAVRRGATDRIQALQRVTRLESHVQEARREKRGIRQGRSAARGVMRRTHLCVVLQANEDRGLQLEL